jgi:hypothetical protein
LGAIQEHNRRLPHPDGERTRARRSQIDDRSLFAAKPVPDGVGRNLAVAPHLYAVPIDLTAAIDMGEIQSEVPVDFSARIPDELPAVPGEPGVIAVALPLPGPAYFDRFPGRVVVGG